MYLVEVMCLKTMDEFIFLPIKLLLGILRPKVSNPQLSLSWK